MPDPKQILGEKEYLCSNCKKKYKLDLARYAKVSGRCKACGGTLIELDFKKY